MKDFSQKGEQPHILAYFGYRFDGDRCIVAPRVPGTFLDIGANDGEILSMSRALALLDWSGVCVEPSPAAFPRLHSLYPDGSSVRCIQAAIVSRDGPITLWESGTHLKKGDVALLSTTIPQERFRWINSGEKFSKVSVRGITFATLMKETGVKKFDFISIDAEGADYTILSQINLTDVGCRMLCVETNNTENKKFWDYAHAHGMKLLHRNLNNMIFVR